MDYIKVPYSIDFFEVQKNNYSLSPAQYKKVIMKNKSFVTVKDFLSRPLSRGDLGSEVGSLSYISKSPYSFIRTKALQANSFLPEITNESTSPILPKSFIQMNLKEGDLLISKDSNIGETVILDKNYPNAMLSGAIYRLPIKDNKYYLLSFLKHNFCREQLDFMVPKSATIRHAKTKFLDIKIPYPTKNKIELIKYVENLTQSIINKEQEIRNKHKLIHEIVENELLANQRNESFNYDFPNNFDVLKQKRIDAGYFCENHLKLIFPTKNYKFGFSQLDKQGLQLIPGPSLEIKILGTRINSKTFKEGFYRLITPKQITNYGTVEYYEYIGTPKKIPSIKFGDILFGESGTGRSMVYLEENDNTINNAHAHILRPVKENCSIQKAIYIRSILSYYKEIGIIDYMTVGSQGGHLSPSYFDRVFIPDFPVKRQEEIAKLYYNPELKIKTKNLTNDNFLIFDNEYNLHAGITELDKTIKSTRIQLDKIIDNIINDTDIKIDFDFLNT